MIEVIVIVALVLWSTLVVFKKVCPRTANTIFLQLSRLCAQQGWLRLAKWLTPTMVAGCGGSCGCSATEESTQKTSDVQAVKWK